MTDFFSERKVKSSRKQYRCDSCQTAIKVGESYVYMAGKWMGDMFQTRNHPECRKAECDYAHIHHLFGGDEWQWLHEMEDEDIEWLRENHPEAAARLSR